MKKKCYIFIPYSFIAIDSLVPLVVTLAQKEFKVYTVFSSLSTSQKEFFTPNYLRIIYDNSLVIDLCVDNTQGVVSKILQRIKSVAVGVKIAFSFQASVITIEPATSLLDVILKVLSALKKKVFCVSKIPAPIPPEWYEFYFVKALNDPYIRKHFIGKSGGTFPAYQKRNYVGRYLMNSSFEGKASDIKGYPDDRIIMGYPKLLPTWLSYASKHNVIWDHPLLDCDETIITVLLLSKHGWMYDPNDSVDVFLNEIVESVRSHYETKLIVLKDKPRLNAEREEWLTNYVESLNDRRLVFSSVPTPFLAKRSELMLMVGDTTACFDFIIREVPSIEHARYSQSYVEYYPEQLSWTQYNVHRTSNVLELWQAIKDVRSGNLLPMPIGELKQIVDHRDNESFVHEL